MFLFFLHTRKLGFTEIILPEVTEPQHGRLVICSQKSLASSPMFDPPPPAPYSESSQVAEKLEMLKKQYDEKLAQKEQLRKKSEEMETKLARAGMLVSGLAGEKARWEETVKVRSVVPPGSPSALPTGAKSPYPAEVEGQAGKMGMLGCRDIQEQGLGILPLPPHTW